MPKTIDSGRTRKKLLLMAHRPAIILRLEMPGGGETAVWYVLARAAFRRNLAYIWAHMANNLGSVLFGLVYMALWQAAAKGRPVGTFRAAELVQYIAVSQTVLWVSTFLPANLGIDYLIRGGQIAMEMARPVAFLPRMAASGFGEGVYNAVFRSLPLALTFTLVGVYPWSQLATAPHVALVAAALALSLWAGILFQYLIGIAAFWTIQSRWTRRLFFGLTMFCGGQLLPLQLMPAGIREVLTWLPFQMLVSLPCSVWLHQANPAMWISGIGWAIGLYGLAWWITRRASRRLEVQGG